MRTLRPTRRERYPAPRRRVEPTSAAFEVDARGRRIPSRASTAPGAELVRVTSIVDVAAIAGLAAHVLVTVERTPLGMLLPALTALLLPLVLVFTSSAASMSGFALRLRRAVGVLLPTVAFVGLAGRSGSGESLPSPAILLPLLTMPIGALAAHRALVLAARKHERASAERASSQPQASPLPRPLEAPRVVITDAWTEAPEPTQPTPRRWTALGVVVLLCGLVVLAVSVLLGHYEQWWFRFLWMAAGVYFIVISPDAGAPTSDRRLRPRDRSNRLVWILPPILALLAVLRLLWFLSR